MATPPNTIQELAQPDPTHDRKGRPIPENVGGLLRIVRLLIAYGVHFAETLRQRRQHKLFPIVAAVFGTHRVEHIINHLHRGTRRAVALQRYLRARAERGLEIPAIDPYPNRDPDKDLAAAPPLGPERGKRPPPRPSGTPLIKVTYTVGPDHSSRFYIPSMKELAKEVRRLPVGQTVMAICLDLGVVPSFCTSALANCLNEVELWFGANHRVAREVLERRQESFLKERGGERGTWDCDWRDPHPDSIRELLGYLAGETPPLPEAPLQYIDWPLPLDGELLDGELLDGELIVSGPPPLEVSPPPLREIPPPLAPPGPPLDAAPPPRRLPGNHIGR